MAAQSHGSSALAAGAKALQDGAQSFAQTQAMWRFLANERVTLPCLAAPLIAGTRSLVAQHCDRFALVAHDWSRIPYRTHTSKKDKKKLSHDTDVGYDLQTSLVLSDQNGAVLGVPAQNLVTEEGLWSSRTETIQRKVPAHLDELTTRMAWLEEQKFGKSLVHIVDREADSVAHLRAWNAAGQRFVIRIKEGSTLTWQEQSLSAAQVASHLTFARGDDVVSQEKRLTQEIASTQVTLTRRAKPAKKKANGQRVAPVAGQAVAVRLVVTRLADADGKTVALWFLLSNLGDTVDAATLARWYTYRWRIESFFKLLKAGGHQLESWEQESGLALFKRLLIVTQACHTAWELIHNPAPEAQTACVFLVRLAGRQMKRRCPITPSAVLDGLFMLLTFLQTLETYTLHDLRSIAQTAFPSRFLPHAA